MTIHQNIQYQPTVLYEVIRIAEGIPLFLEDHLERLNHSANLTGINTIPGQDELSDLIKKFLLTEKRDSGNIKLSFSCDNHSNQSKFSIDFIPHVYPAPGQYTEGVSIGLMNADRIVPNAKVQNSDIRERADKLISDNNFYEILLVGSDKNITEGSRSNVFFIKSDTLYSAPDDKILEGITRKKVLQICRINNIPVVATAIPANNLNQYDAAFLTGTSPKVLPISSIDRVVYKINHPLLLRIQQEYNQLVENYLIEKRQSINYQ